MQDRILLEVEYEKRSNVSESQRFAATQVTPNVQALTLEQYVSYPAGCPDLCNRRTVTTIFPSLFNLKIYWDGFVSPEMKPFIDGLLSVQVPRKARFITSDDITDETQTFMNTTIRPVLDGYNQAIGEALTTYRYDTYARTWGFTTCQ
jgi:hypothetical protein